MYEVENDRLSKKYTDMCSYSRMKNRFISFFPSNVFPNRSLSAEIKIIKKLFLYFFLLKSEKNKHDFYSKLSMLIVILNLEKRSVPVIHFILGKAIGMHLHNSFSFNAIMFE